MFQHCSINVFCVKVSLNLNFFLNKMLTVSDKTSLQIVVKKDLVEKSQRKAEEFGFNSVPEMIRSMLISITSGNKLLTPFNSLSQDREGIYDKEIEQAKNDYKAKDIKLFNSAIDLIDDIEGKVK